MDRGTIDDDWRAFEVPETPLGPMPEPGRQARLYSRGLNKTLATPHRKRLTRLAIQRALKDYHATSQNRVLDSGA